jgi:hypothetical protein
MNLEGYLRAIMLEAICVLSCSPLSKVVKKVHPGAESSILKSGGSSSKALPGEVESILGQKWLSLRRGQQSTLHIILSAIN